MNQLDSCFACLQEFVKKEIIVRSLIKSVSFISPVKICDVNTWQSHIHPKWVLEQWISRRYC